MNILRKLLYIPYMWYWMIPLRMGVIAFAGYFLMMFAIYGTISPTEIKLLLKDNGITMFWGYFIPFGIPTLLAFGAMFAATGASNIAPSPTALEDAIAYRNGQMSITTPQKAAEILNKTSNLDAMKVYGDMEVMKIAQQGFDAKYGASTPNRVFDDMMKK